MARYSDHLFANVLLPFAFDGMDTNALGPALERAAHVSVTEGAQLCALVVGAAPTESDALHELRERLERERQERGLCLLYTSPSPRDRTRSRMPSSA